MKEVYPLFTFSKSENTFSKIGTFQRKKVYKKVNYFLKQNNSTTCIPKHKVVIPSQISSPLENNFSWKEDKYGSYRMLPLHWWRGKGTW